MGQLSGRPAAAAAATAANAKPAEGHKLQIEKYSDILQLSRKLNHLVQLIRSFVFSFSVIVKIFLFGRFGFKKRHFSLDLKSTA